MFVHEPDPDKRSFYEKQILTAKNLLEEANLYISSDNKTVKVIYLSVAILCM
jgi:hypothetical protein